jgi:hypothetical protein
MSDTAIRTAHVPRPVGPGLLAAQRAVQAAELATAAGQGPLSWQQLRQWPAWALAGRPAASWLRALGACWRAAELQQCIDGVRLNALCDDLGAQALQVVLQLDVGGQPNPPAPARLPAAGSASDWRDVLLQDGQSVALASVEDSGLRQVLAAVLGWRMPSTGLPSDQAQAWVAALPPVRP